MRGFAEHYAIHHIIKCAIVFIIDVCNSVQSAYTEQSAAECRHRLHLWEGFIVLKAWATTQTSTSLICSTRVRLHFSCRVVWNNNAAIIILELEYSERFCIYNTLWNLERWYCEAGCIDIGVAHQISHIPYVVSNNHYYFNEYRMRTRWRQLLLQRCTIPMWEI